jgi:hypothetical protein
LKAEIASSAPAALGDGSDEPTADAEIVEPAAAGDQTEGAVSGNTVGTPGKDN